MKKIILAAAIAAGLGVGAANAGTSTQIDSIVEQLKAQGFSHINIDAGDALLIVEARRGLYLRHFLVNRQTGKVFGDKMVLSFATAPAGAPDESGHVSDIRRGSSRVIAISSGQTEVPQAGSGGGTDNGGKASNDEGRDGTPAGGRKGRPAGGSKGGAPDRGASSAAQEPCYLSGEDDCEPDAAEDPEAYQDWKEERDAREKAAKEQEPCYLSGEDDCEPDAAEDPEAYQDWKEERDAREKAAMEQEQTRTNQDQADQTASN